MPDLHDRFRSFDGIAVPDLWDEIEERAEAPATTVGPVVAPPAWRPSSRFTLVILLAILLLALIASLVIGRARPGPNPMLFETSGSDPSGGQLYAVGPDDRAPRLVFGKDAVRVHVSPDGRHALFGVDDGLMIARTDGSGVASVAGSNGVEAGREWETVWSPDSSVVAFDAGATDRPGLVIADVNGRERRRIDLPPGTFFETFWSPDGRHILLRVSRNDDDPSRNPQRVILADTTTGEIVEIGAELDLVIPPTWSTDGRFVATEIQRGPVATIAVIDIATQGVTELQPGVAANMLAWSPDERSILWTESEVGGHVAVHSIARAGGQQVLVAEMPGSSAVWSPDRQHLLAVEPHADRTTSLWVLDLPNVRPRLLTDHGESSGSVIWPKWSPDGVWIAFGRGPFDLTSVVPGGSIWIIHPDGSGERPLVDPSLHVDMGIVDW